MWRFGCVYILTGEAAEEVEERCEKAEGGDNPKNEVPEVWGRGRHEPCKQTQNRLPSKTNELFGGKFNPSQYWGSPTSPESCKNPSTISEHLNGHWLLTTAVSTERLTFWACRAQSALSETEPTGLSILTFITKTTHIPQATATESPLLVPLSSPPPGSLWCVGNHSSVFFPL